MQKLEKNLKFIKYKNLYSLNFTQSIIDFYYLFSFINYFSHINYQRLDFIKHHLLNQYSLYLINQLYNTKYFCIIKSSLNNLFISVVNFRGEVILKDSRGNKLLNTKKKKTSLFSLKALIRRIILGLLRRRILVIDTLVFTSFDQK